MGVKVPPPLNSFGTKPHFVSLIMYHTVPVHQGQTIEHGESAVGAAAGPSSRCSCSTTAKLASGPAEGRRLAQTDQPSGEDIRDMLPAMLYVVCRDLFKVRLDDADGSEPFVFASTRHML
jgi:hypothetical protein